MWKSMFFKNRSGAYLVGILEFFGVAERGKRDARGGSSGDLWNLRAMPKSFDFITIQARERLRQDDKWTLIFGQNTVFIAILAPNGFRIGIWRKWQKFEVHMALLAKAFQWFSMIFIEIRKSTYGNSCFSRISEKWLLAETCSKNSDLRGFPKGLWGSSSKAERATAERWREPRVLWGIKGVEETRSKDIFDLSRSGPKAWRI